MFRRFLRFLKRVWRAIKAAFSQDELNAEADKVWEEGIKIEDEMNVLEEKLNEIENGLQKLDEESRKTQSQVSKAYTKYISYKNTYDRKWAELGGENNPEYSGLVGKLYAVEEQIICGDAYQSSEEYKANLHAKKQKDLDDWLRKNVPEKFLMEEAQKEVEELKKKASEFRGETMGPILRAKNQCETQLAILLRELEKKQKALSEIERKIRKNRTKTFLYVLGIMGSGLLIKGVLTPEQPQVEIKQKPNKFARFSNLGVFLKLSNILLETLAEFKIIDPLFQSILSF